MMNTFALINFTACRQNPESQQIKECMGNDRLRLLLKRIDAKSPKLMAAASAELCSSLLTLAATNS